MAVSGLVTLVILGALGVTVYTAVSNLIVSDSISRLEDFAQSIARPLDNSQMPSPRTLDPQWGTRYAGVFILGWISLPDGDISPFVRTQPLPPGIPVMSAVSASGTKSTDLRDVVTAQGVPLRVYTVAGQLVDNNGNAHQFYVQTAADRSQEIDLLHLLLVVLLVGGAGALLLSLLAGYFYAGRALVPIRSSMNRREAALQRQREFAANASHELRTPLTVIGASVEDLKRNRRSRVEDVGEALGDIDAEVHHMTALVEDLLLLARTDSGVVQVERVPVDLSDIAVEAASMLSGLGEEKAVKVELDAWPALVLGDQLRLRQLVTILTDNAIRHTNQGSTVRVQIHPDTTVAIMRVDDQGPGVKPEDLPRIFERFWRADDAPEGGTGLGLSIAKWIVEQHGGTIGAYNRPEGGASFWVQLPLYVAQAPGAAAVTPSVTPSNGAGHDAATEAAGQPTWRPEDDAVPVSRGDGA
jgi:signal transduction histidine kinase